MTDAIVRSDLGALVQVADALGNAGPMLPSHITSKGEALAIIMAGDELGIPPMASLRGLHLVKGKVGMDYSLMVGLLRRAGYRVQWTAKSDTRCELLLTHPDGSKHTEVWDVERAKKAKLWGNAGPWTQYPEAMLTARCVSSAARAFAGDVLAGCYSMEEVREIAADRPTARIGNADVHVAEVIDPEQTYSHQPNADSKAAAQARAQAYVDSVAEYLREMAGEAASEMHQAHETFGADADELGREQQAIHAAHAKLLRTWCHAQHEPIAAAFNHPATSNARAKLWRLIKAWADSAHVDTEEVKSWLSTEARAA